MSQPDPTIEERASQLFDEHRARTERATDRMFAVLMVVQWVAAVIVALIWSPFGWEGKTQTVHVHVQAALFLGGAISSLPLLLIWKMPGALVTRLVVGAAQMLWSALLIHLSGGRIETHFHVFGSLAFLAFYRDWRVLVPATVVVAGDHLVRGIFWPESVYGIVNPEWWRFLEHAFWVVFEDIVLVFACVRGTAEMHMLARRHAEVEALSLSEQRKSLALAAAHKEVERSRDALVRSEKLAAVGQLAASVGHELRNPLAAVRSAVTYIERRLTSSREEQKPVDDPRVQQFVGIVHNELDACARIVGDLLDFARERKPDRQPCPLRPLVDDAIRLVPDRNVAIQNDIPADLPVPSLDRDMFRQVLVNLVQNAVEASPGDGAGRVVVSAAAERERFVVKVGDNGSGINRDMREKVFEPLFTTKTKGTGLGLAIVANIVKAHGGTIRFDGGDGGKGTTAIIELATSTATSTAAAASAAAASVASLAAAHGVTG